MLQAPTAVTTSVNKQEQGEKTSESDDGDLEKDKRIQDSFYGTQNAYDRNGSTDGIGSGFGCNGSENSGENDEDNHGNQNGDTDRQNVQNNVVTVNTNPNLQQAIQSVAKNQ